ncbi:hypothetical protein SNA21_09580, partial [Escherichia coli]|nr:hypothetical protein [Escherichia coli]
DLTFRLLVAIGGVFLLYATYHMGGSFFFCNPLFLWITPPKAPPFTPKSSTFHPQKLHLSPPKAPLILPEHL